MTFGSIGSNSSIFEVGFLGEEMEQGGPSKKRDCPPAAEAEVITSGMLQKVAQVDKSQGFQHHDPAIPSHKKAAPKRKASPVRSSSPESWCSGSKSPTSPLSQRKTEKLKAVDGDEEDPSMELVTRIGRYRAWHPEKSLVKEPPQYRVPPIEELEAMYKMPVRRLRKREDGVGGTTLWQPTEPIPIGVEAAIAKNFGLSSDKEIKVAYPHLGAWRDVLRDPSELLVEKIKTNLKRSRRYFTQIKKFDPSEMDIWVCVIFPVHLGHIE